MKLAIPWSNIKKNQYGDEYNISFNQKNNDFDTLFDFLNKHKDIRFNILIEDMTIQQMVAAATVNKNTHFRISQVMPPNQLKEMKERKLLFFFDVIHAPSSFCLLEEQLQFGVTDTYIYDDLCYNLIKVKELCKKYNVQIRMILNKLPSRRLDKGINAKAPYFTPESIKDLEQYIDIVEFDSSSWIKIETYYRIWFQRQEWHDNLSYLYKDLELDIPNQSLIPNFLTFKMNCNYKCSYGSPCNKCEQFVEIAQDLRDKNIYYEKRS